MLERCANEKATHKMEKNISSHISDNGLISRINKELLQFNNYNNKKHLKINTGLFE